MKDIPSVSVRDPEELGEQAVILDQAVESDLEAAVEELLEARGGALDAPHQVRRLPRPPTPITEGGLFGII